MKKDEIIIFSDGSSRGNPGPGGFGAIVVFDGKVVELGGQEKNTTNNRMEMSAIIEALSFFESYELQVISYKVYTDCSYLINGITKWISGWKRNGWITKTKEEVLNRDLWKKLDGLVSDKNIKWNYVGGHAGIAGNERCDEIATEFADGKNPNLYNGLLSKYKIDILNLEENETAKIRKEKNRSKLPAYSYVSMADGVVEIHKTWAECERRVKGKSGVKFKKVFSEEEENKLIEEWSKQK